MTGEPQEIMPISLPAECWYCHETVAPYDAPLASRPGPKPCMPMNINGKWEPLHAECWVRFVMGSAEHILGECTCRRGAMGREEPVDMPRREAARRAYQAWMAKEMILGDLPKV